MTARLTERGKTPWVAFSVYLALALSYLVANLALPVYYHRFEEISSRSSNISCFHSSGRQRSAIRSTS